MCCLLPVLFSLLFAPAFLPVIASLWSRNSSDEETVSMSKMIGGLLMFLEAYSLGWACLSLLTEKSFPPWGTVASVRIWDKWMELHSIKSNLSHLHSVDVETPRIPGKNVTFFFLAALSERVAVFNCWEKLTRVGVALYHKSSAPVKSVSSL